MADSARKLLVSATLVGVSIVCATGVQRVVFGRQAQPGSVETSAEAVAVAAISPYIETHTHFDDHDPEGSVQAAIKALNHQNASKIFLEIPPNIYGDAGNYDVEVILAAARKYPDKLAVIGGGGSLNAMILQSVQSGDSGPKVQKAFTERAEKLVRDGIIGFGEMTAEHFPSSTPYQYAPPDHPLYLLLADIAARHNMPIILHMESVPETMPLPSDLKSPPNPPQLQANIAGFERLLAHNTRAKIIWAHVGADQTGFRTSALCRQLLQAHPNLFMDLKIDPLNLGQNRLLEDGKVKPEWLKLFQDFPARFVIGSDQHYPEPRGPQRWQAIVLLFNQLPGDLRRKIGMENALRIFPFKPNKLEDHASRK